MKRSMYLIGVVFLLAGMIFASGCSGTKKPQDAFKSYAALWNKKDFKSMYSMLSTAAKKTISEDDFISRYQTIYDGIGLSSISIKPQYPKKIEPDDKGEVHIPYTTKMVTLAGNVDFTNNVVLVKEKQGKKESWVVDWNVTMIFPEMKDKDKVRFISLEGKRGEILDRNGNVLAGNGNADSVGIVPDKIGSSKDDNIKQISKLLNVPQDTINKELGASWVKGYMFVPITEIPEGDSREADLLKIPGVKINKTPARIYPLKESAAHLIGYIGPVTKDDIDKGEGYSDGDIIGKAGLEYVFEKRLRAQNGGEIYIVNENGNKEADIAKKEPKDGETIKLTIDSKLQQAAYNQLKGDSGSLAAINPKTGETLALVSSPSYDPNLFALGLNDAKWASYKNDPEKPLTNRFASVYAPGSTFKVVTASIGLAAGKINPDEKVNITGKKWQADTSWGSYYVTRVTDPGHAVNLRDAFVYSDNIYFAQAALKIGKDKFIDGAKSFGIGESFPLSFPIGDSKIAEGGTIKNDIQLADSGYGQGEVSVSTIQLAFIYSAFANGGNIPQPVLELKDVSGKIWHQGAVSQSIAAMISSDLIQVVEDPHGTAHGAYISGMRIAAKTGTAELKSSKSDTEAEENGWSAAYNADNPKLLVTMMVEKVKEKGGSHYVIPKVKNILSQFAK